MRVRLSQLQAPVVTVLVTAMLAAGCSSPTGPSPIPVVSTTPVVADTAGDLTIRVTGPDPQDELAPCMTEGCDSGRMQPQAGPLVAAAVAVAIAATSVLLLKYAIEDTRDVYKACARDVTDEMARRGKLSSAVAENCAEKFAFAVAGGRFTDLLNKLGFKTAHSYVKNKIKNSLSKEWIVALFNKKTYKTAAAFLGELSAKAAEKAYGALKDVLSDASRR